MTNNQTPAIGDGAVTVFYEEELTMEKSIDLPPNVASALQTQSIGDIQADSRRGRDTATLSNGVLQAAMARNFDELGTVEGRAVSGVTATPVASPATQS